MAKENASQLTPVLLVSMLTSFILIFFCVGWKDDKNEYFKFGYNPDLIVVSVRIDTYERYCWMMSILTIVTLCRAYVSEVGSPILRYYIYDMNTTEITDISFCRLQVLSTSIYTLTALRDIFLLKAGIAQLDIALVILVVYQIVSTRVVYWLTKDKIYTEGKPLVEVKVKTQSKFYDKKGFSKI